ncbi:MAG: alpha/beta hydrolase-fold protein [Sediminibacterium sp.]
MRKHRLLVSIIALFLIQILHAQEVYHFTKALVVSGITRYGREAIYTDQLAYQLFSNTLEKPAEKKLFGKNERGQDIFWEPVTADSLYRFRTRGGGFGGGAGGYYYLTYDSEKETTALLNVKGNSSLFFNGEPHGGDAYSSGWLYIPVKVKKGTNELYIRAGQMTVDLLPITQPVFISTPDSTVPSVVLTHDNAALKGAVVIVNAGNKELKGLSVRSVVNGKEKNATLPAIPALSTRKIIFPVDASAVIAKGQVTCSLRLFEKDRVIDEKNILLDVVDPSSKYMETFVSDIDGSLQYYAVTPQLNGPQKNAALFLSVHGAGVEAIGQARAYQSKDWGTLVAATNRRPRGFNWEDWGRLDALEVLEIAKQKFNPDPQQIYLTGHSMGGHGTWFLGSTYPDKWAAIGAAAGYPTLKGYGSADGLIPDSSRSAAEQILLRASNPSDVLKLVTNYKPLGVYILHGDMDRTVSVNYARQMRKILGEFHSDMSYYEYPGGDHWFGDQSVDWKPMFDFFKWHKLAADTSFDKIEFITANPGISASYRWSSIEQQEHPLQYAKLNLARNRKTATINGSTENVELLKLKLKEFGMDKNISITLDQSPVIRYTTTQANDSIYLVKENGAWKKAELPGAQNKSPLRYGTFKDPFNHRMVFVYATAGSAEENQWSFDKARFDAETWYYRANGSVDLVADKDYSLENYAGRNVIVYGNSSTNRAWKILLSDCPIQVDKNKITAGEQSFTGNDLAAYFTWPIKSSSINSVGVVGGTGLAGMRATLGNQYFAGGSGFADYMIFSLDMLAKGSDGIKMAGYFDNNWRLTTKESFISK